jgi:hypothetical protein
MKANSCIEGRCLQTVWRIKMGQTSVKHYAIYPAELCERPIAMTCPLSCCSLCDHLAEREVQMIEYDEKRPNKRVIGKYNNLPIDESISTGRMDSGRAYVPRRPNTLGWTRCDHMPDNRIPGLVLDPFVGSGTTGEVALKLGRRFIGIDLYQNYCDLAASRCQKVLDFLNDNDIDHLSLQR